MAITAGMVRALREKTGLPMMECKHALEEANGDEAKAIELLRKKGLGQVSKRLDRATSEGRVACYVDAQNTRGGIVELQCETAPVANTDDFIKLANLLAQAAAEMEQPTPETILAQPCPGEAGVTLQDKLTDVVNKIRENIKVARVSRRSGEVGRYLHHNGQVGVLVEMSAPCSEEMKADVCMHIAAMRPVCTRREEIDPALVEQERAMAADQVKDKPPQIVDKIVEGKLNRWFAEQVLLEQPFVKDDKKSVGEYLASVPNLTVNGYLRYEVGQVA